MLGCFCLSSFIYCPLQVCEGLFPPVWFLHDMRAVVILGCLEDCCFIYRLAMSTLPCSSVGLLRVYVFRVVLLFFCVYC